MFPQCLSLTVTCSVVQRRSVQGVSSFYESQSKFSDVREHSLKLGSHVRWKASTYLFETRKTWKNATLKGVELFSFSLTKSLENPEKCKNIALAFYFLPKATQFERLNPALCGSGEIKMTIKHLLTVVRRSAALFVLSGLDVTETWHFFFFVQSYQNLWLKTNVPRG